MTAGSVRGEKDACTRAGVVVHRGCRAEARFLLLHRTGFEDGEWAWVPPGGWREPGETARACATRELWEETGLSLPLTDHGTSRDARVFAAEAPRDAEIRLSAEHDAYEWVTLGEALRRCRPIVLAEHVLRVWCAVSSSVAPLRTRH